jgi:hypothetical protein
VLPAQGMNLRIAFAGVAINHGSMDCAGLIYNSLILSLF